MSADILGIVGGSGLYDIEGLTDKDFVKIDTPFGQPSGEYLTGVLAGTKIVFLPRHGIGHTLLPSEINFRANIHGFRQLGVRHLLSVSAVGSLKPEVRPGDLVIPDQFIDRTRGRNSTFFGQGVAVHVQFGDPVCPSMVNALDNALKNLGVRHHRGGTYVAMEGPAFSTRAESELYRSWAADVIGMTSIPEAKLAREAEICYATLALSTDYDCWHLSEEEVSVESVLAVIKQNIASAKKAVTALAENFPPPGTCKCQQALDGALLTKPEQIPQTTRQRLNLLLERFFDS
ncbi:MAG: S-methyl-5'-thioadenosine phosphorylase [Deltaproteobacteria bacterium]|nr:S-methyl-5'-thioadenosine phosphorylase [Deltaproteobacteria bacterium]